jgi:ribosomal protein S12 methylthiotransferase
MLDLMKRSHGRIETEAILNRLRNELPDAVIRTTLIAGHPGETEIEYEELKQFISSFRFDRLGVFAYSHEEDTYSWRNYEDDVPEEVKESRVAELMAIQQNISAGLNEKMVGKSFKVIIDKREGDYFIGRTEYDSPEVDQEVLVSSDQDLLAGNFYNIRITSATEFDLFGEPV